MEHDAALSYRLLSRHRSALMGLALLWVMVFHAYAYHFRVPLLVRFQEYGYLGVSGGPPPPPSGGPGAPGFSRPIGWSWGATASGWSIRGRFLSPRCSGVSPGSTIGSRFQGASTGMYPPCWRFICCRPSGFGPCEAVPGPDC